MEQRLPFTAGIVKRIFDFIHLIRSYRFIPRMYRGWCWRQLVLTSCSPIVNTSAQSRTTIVCAASKG
jgi:hypothetical protein